MFTKYIAYTALCVSTLVGFATADSSCGTPDCECKERLLQEEFITDHSERLHEAEKQLFPNGHYNVDEHMELKKRQEERRLKCASAKMEILLTMNHNVMNVNLAQLSRMLLKLSRKNVSNHKNRRL